MSFTISTPTMVAPTPVFSSDGDMGYRGEPRFCKDCAHYAKMAERSHMECGAAVDLVTGKPRHADPYYMRENETECGRLARYFKPKGPVK